MTTKWLNMLKILQPLLQALHEKCPNTEFFLVRIFPHSDWIRRDTEYLSVFSPNAGKYGPEKSLYYDTFHAVRVFNVSLTILWTIGIRKLTSSMSDGLFCCQIAQIWRMWNFPSPRLWKECKAEGKKWSRRMWITCQNHQEFRHFLCELTTFFTNF